MVNKYIEFILFLARFPSREKTLLTYKKKWSLKCNSGFKRIKEGNQHKPGYAGEGREVRFVVLLEYTETPKKSPANKDVRA